MNTSIKKRIHEVVIEQIKKDIEEKNLLPGDRLPSERAMASNLAVSRTSIKEAFSVLQSAGLIEIKHGSGARLLKDNTADIVMKMNMIVKKEAINIVEVMELRQAIECEAASLAAIRSSKEDIKILKMALNTFEKAVFSKNVVAKEDFDFHMCIAKASRNLLFVEVMYMLSDRLLSALHKIRKDTIHNSGKSDVILAEHITLFEAIQNGDPVKAREAMNDHLNNVKDRYI